MRFGSIVIGPCVMDHKHGRGRGDALQASTFFSLCSLRVESLFWQYPCVCETQSKGYDTFFPVIKWSLFAFKSISS